MKISYKWLKEIFPSLKASPQTVAQRLSEVGFEIDALEDKAFHIPHLVIGQVVEVGRHPNADRLSLCKVSDGRKVYQVVCGAPNVTAGKKYPFALPEAQLPNGMTLRPTQIRGIESFGMLCSAHELGFSGESNGIYELEEEAPLGPLFSSYCGDMILDVAVPPNRGDCLSHYGLAREVGVLFNLPFKIPPVHRLSGGFPIQEAIRVEIKDQNGCRRYGSRAIRGVRIAPSPAWLCRRLSSLGIRPINNVVDATNYVMMETGHPLHAFDKRFVAGGKIIVRKCGEPLKFETLDHEIRDLVPDDIVIADEKGMIALAGVMGGKNSEVRDDTTELVLEAACFDQTRIRRTARRLGLRTESSLRFERGVNPQTVIDALDRLTALIIRLAGGEASREVIDRHPRKPAPFPLFLRGERLNQAIGQPVPLAEAGSILKKLGLTVAKAKGGYRVTVPLFRSDLTREIDLIEEVVRFRGFDTIPSILPPTTHRLPFESDESRLEDFIKQTFVSHGFSETIHYSFCSPRELEKTGKPGPAPASLQNPLSPDSSVLRPGLLSGLLESVRKNMRYALHEGIRLFELRTVFSPPRTEQKRVAGIYGGALMPRGWQSMNQNADFFFGKGVLESLFQTFHLQGIEWRPKRDHPQFHPLQCLELCFRERRLGFSGRLHPQILDNFEISLPLYAFDLDYSGLVNLWREGSPHFEKICPFPQVVRDMALVMEKNMTYGEVVDAIRELTPVGLSRITLFDIYEGEKLKAGQKSMAFRLVYENSLRTLTDEEVNEAHFDLVKRLQAKLDVRLR